ncbi:MAG: hypothetical protein LIO75_09350 [Lachnospiraceae bacterium]|nr:hypothetical protein [Lachnospiraceae bacterium]
MENTENQTRESKQSFSRDREQSRQPAGIQQTQPPQMALVEVCVLVLRIGNLLVLGIVVGAFIVGAWVYTRPYEYQSRTLVYSVTDSSASAVSSLLSDLQLGSTVSEDYAIVAKSKAVLDTAIEQVEEETGVTLTRGQISSSFSVTNEEDTHVLVFTVTTEDPELSSSIANAVTEATANMMANIINVDPPVIFETAEPEYTPIDNGLTTRAAEGAVAGLVIMAILVLIPYLLDDKISTKQDVEKYLGCGVLGVIPLDKEREHRQKKR